MLCGCGVPCVMSTPSKYIRLRSNCWEAFGSVRARRTRELLYVMVISSLWGCAEQRPLVECTGKIVAKILSDECDSRLWQVPLEVRLGDRVVDSIDPDVREFTRVSWSTSLATKSALLGYGLASASLDSAAATEMRVGNTWTAARSHRISWKNLREEARAIALRRNRVPPRWLSGYGSKGLGVIQSSFCVWCHNVRSGVANTPRLRLTGRRGMETSAAPSASRERE